MPRDTDGAALRELLDKQQIREVLLRYCRAVDRRDEQLLRSVYHPDAIHEYGHHALRGPEFAGLVVQAIGRFEATSHLLHNELVEIRGDVAFAESYVLACHRGQRDGAPCDLTLALRYVDRLERREGRWRIAHRRTLHDWSREDPVARAWPDAPDLLQGRRDRRDASYER
jgi:ketosteroid isomerase-like protein